MSGILKTIAATASLLLASAVAAQNPPWDNGRLTVSDDGRRLQHENGAPFFWLADTGWLLPEKLDRTDAEFYLESCRRAGFNVVQVQVVNGVPATNVYGAQSMPDGFDFSRIGRNGDYGYWDHLDYIVDCARDKGIYVGMVCIWGGLVKAGLMNTAEAESYGRFLAERYKDAPNIVWIIGGDIRGDIKTEVWETLARTIKRFDANHLMSFHPFGRTSSATWFHDAEWLDFNMFQSGHRRYDQTRGDGDSTAQASVAEDNWRYVAEGLSRVPAKPILDAEPSYEDIPQGLHDTLQPRWQAHDARRYAYWSVFAGACGHTYGHNSIMQMHGGGRTGAYGARKPWREAMLDPGFNQMKHLRRLMETFPCIGRQPDQSVIASGNGTRYDRAAAMRGRDYLMVYTHTNRPLTVDLRKIEGRRKHVWWYDVTNGKLEYVGLFRSGIRRFRHDGAEGPGNDRVLIAADSESQYIAPEQPAIAAE